jgi:hypothetical protein
MIGPHLKNILRASGDADKIIVNVLAMENDRVPTNFEKRSGLDRRSCHRRPVRAADLGTWITDGGRTKKKANCRNQSDQ